MIHQGIVSSIEESGARAARPGMDNYVTGLLYIPPHIGALRVGQRVAYIEFTDLTGVILSVLEE